MKTFVLCPRQLCPLRRVSFNLHRRNFRSAVSSHRVSALAHPLQPRHWGHASRCGMHFESRNQAYHGTMLMIFFLFLISTEVISFNVDRYALKRTSDRPSLFISAKPTNIIDEAESHHFAGKNQNQREFTGERIRSGVGQKIDQSPSLVLNADYTPLSHLPLSLWCWQDTLRAVFSGKAVVVSEYSDLIVRSVSCSFPLPSVIALTTYQKCPNQIPVMSRRNVYIRDGFKCQYCTETFPIKDLSLDHVIPKSRGGKLAWTNTVTACLACNFKKGQVSPEDLPSIGMRLRMLPRAPTNNELQYKAKHFKKSHLHPHWVVYV